MSKTKSLSRREPVTSDSWRSVQYGRRGRRANYSREVGEESTTKEPADASSCLRQEVFDRYGEIRKRTALKRMTRECLNRTPTVSLVRLEQDSCVKQEYNLAEQSGSLVIIFSYKVA